MPSIFLLVLRLVHVVMPWFSRTWQPKPSKSLRLWRFRVKFVSRQFLHLDFEVSNVEIETSATYLEAPKPELKSPSSQIELPSSKLEFLNPETQKTEIASADSEDENLGLTDRE